MLKEIEQKLDTLFPELVKLRSDLHRFPELAWEEQRTTEVIEGFLSENGLSRLQRFPGSGLMVEIVSRQDAPYLAFRADIDALPIQDEKLVPYHSQNNGVCHACGHDINASVGCGIAVLLNQFKEELPVNSRIVFQPAEEPIPSGAPKLIEAGVLKNVMAILAMHLEPTLPLNTISLTEGWVNAQSIRLDWQIHGSGGHSARPQLAQNPLHAGAELLQRVQRYMNEWPQTHNAPIVFTFTRFLSGRAYNAIPKTAELTATLRQTVPERGASIIKGLKELTSQIRKEHRLKIDFEFRSGAPPVINHSGLVRLLRDNYKNFGVTGTTLVDDFRSMGGDDFGWYARLIPAAMVRFGNSEGANSPPLHSPLFDSTPEVIRQAVLFFFAQFLMWSASPDDLTYIIEGVN